MVHQNHNFTLVSKSLKIGQNAGCKRSTFPTPEKHGKNAESTSVGRFLHFVSAFAT